MNENAKQRKLTLRQMIGSVLAAGFGVQSQRNRERDFQYGSPTAFILLGLTATLLFVLAIVLVVKLVLKAVGA